MQSLQPVQQYAIDKMAAGGTLPKLFEELGCLIKNYGIGYIMEAVEVYGADPTIALTKKGGLYDQVAQKFGTSATRVERAIRHTIEVIANSMHGAEILASYGITMDPKSGKRSNGEFIFALVIMLKKRGEH